MIGWPWNGHAAGDDSASESKLQAVNLQANSAARWLFYPLIPLFGVGAHCAEGLRLSPFRQAAMHGSPDGKLEVVEHTK